MYQDWPERDEVLTSMDRNDVLCWSAANEIVWPQCAAKFWIVLHYAITLLKAASQSEIESAEKHLHRSNVVARNGVRIVLGNGTELKLSPKLRLT